MDILDRAFADAADDYEAGLRICYDALRPRLKRPPESKIEEAMLIGFMSVHLIVRCFEFDTVEATDQEDVFTDNRVGVRSWGARLIGQATIDRYRADFLVEVLRKGEVVGKIVVECDGHDFHERTKDQAERDRSRDRHMTAAGYKVLRFTGREIHRSPVACCADVVKLVIDTAFEAKA